MSISKRTILLTGGAGYIGAHTAVQLVATGKYRACVVDNLANSCQEAVDALAKLIPSEDFEYHNIDLVSEKHELEKLHFDGVIHFAALKAVGDSVARPLDYYSTNVNALLNILSVCKHKNVKHFVFSSSATVYQPCEQLLTEDSPLGASNPYGQTKVIGEQICRDLLISDQDWKITLLRYFNPIGAHPSGSMGESPELPMNILPIIQKVAVGKQEKVFVCGNDWPTRDGTGVRDYIHVMDLADGHVLALDKLFEMTGQLKQCQVYNLGTGKGVSVLEMIAAFEKACGKSITYEIAPRRPGDLATVVADPAKAQRELGFNATRTTDDACESAWKWQSTHPDGFKTKA